MFNSYFASVFTSDLSPADYHNNASPPTTSGGPYETINELNWSEDEIPAALKFLDPDKALGPDGISRRALRETAGKIAPYSAPNHSDLVSSQTSGK